MEEGIFLERSKMELFKKYGRPGFTAMELYVYYLFKSLEQGSDIINISHEETRKELDWGRDKFLKCKKILSKLNLIEVIIKKDSQGKFCGSFMKIY